MLRCASNRGMESGVCSQKRDGEHINSNENFITQRAGMRAIVRLAVCGVAVAGSAMAQDVRGSATGVVSDNQKHGIADVNVTVSSKELGVLSAA